MRSVLFFAALLLFAGTAARGAEPLARAPYYVAFDNRLSVDVFLNGQGPFHLLIDTGSSQTILFSAAATRLGLLPIAGGKILVHSIADSETSPPYELRSLALGAETINDLLIAVLQDPADPSKGPDGILGIDVLSRYADVFDRRAGELLLFPRNAGVPLPYASWQHTALTSRRLKDVPIDFWFLDAVYSHEHAKTLLDLGTGVTILTWELARHLVPARAMPSKNDDEVHDALGKGLPAFRLEGLEVEVARRAWYGQIALVADAPVFQFLDFADQPAGIIGAGLLKDNSFAIDFANERLYVGPRQ